MSAGRSAWLCQGTMPFGSMVSLRMRNRRSLILNGAFATSIEAMTVSVTHQKGRGRQGDHVLQRDRPVQARGRLRCHLAPVNAQRVRQSAARNAVPDVQSIGWARLARARLGLPG